MPLDPISAIANAITAIGGVITPFVESHFEQLFDKQHQARIREWQEIMAEGDNRTRADLMHEFILRLLNNSGQAIPRGLSRNVSVPLDVLNALIAEVSEGIKKDQLLSKVRFK